MFARPRPAQPKPWHARVPDVLLLRLPACWPSWSSRKSDDLGFENCTARMGSAGRVGWTRQGLSGLVGNELIEVDGGEIPTRSLGAPAEREVFHLAHIDVAVERLDRDIEPRGSLGRGQQPTWHTGMRLALTSPGLGIKLCQSLLHMRGAVAKRLDRLEPRIRPKDRNLNRGQRSHPARCH